MQVIEIKDTCIKKIEQIMFGYIWLRSGSDKERGIGRIKRAILKNKYSEGGLNVTVVECLNKSIKLRQF